MFLQDPDAPIRQNKLLDDLDKDDERRLLQTLFLCLRGGNVDQVGFLSPRRGMEKKTFKW